MLMLSSLCTLMAKLRIIYNSFILSNRYAAIKCDQWQEFLKKNKKSRLLSRLTNIKYIDAGSYTDQSDRKQPGKKHFKQLSLF